MGWSSHGKIQLVLRIVCVFRIETRVMLLRASLGVLLATPLLAGASGRETGLFEIYEKFGICHVVQVGPMPYIGLPHIVHPPLALNGMADYSIGGMVEVRWQRNRLQRT